MHSRTLIHSTVSSRLLLATYLILASTIVLGLTGVQAREPITPPKVEGQHLQTTPLAGDPSKEIDIQVYVFPPNSAVPWHVHQGAHEIQYGLEGTLMIQEEGSPPVALKAGASNYLAPDVVHRGWNPSKTEPVKIFVVRIKPAGSPLTTLVEPKTGAPGGSEAVPSAGAHPNATE